MRVGSHEHHLARCRAGPIWQFRRQIGWQPYSTSHLHLKGPATEPRGQPVARQVPASMHAQMPWTEWPLLPASGLPGIVRSATIRQERYKLLKIFVSYFDSLRRQSERFADVVWLNPFKGLPTIAGERAKLRRRAPARAAGAVQWSVSARYPIAAAGGSQPRGATLCRRLPAGLCRQAQGIAAAFRYPSVMM
jgi:hypothetical protein